MTAPEKEYADGTGDSTAVIPRSDAGSQAEGIRVLLSMAVDRAENLLDEIAERDVEALSGPIDIPLDSGVAAGSSERALQAEPSRPRRAGQRAKGRHAVPSRRHGVRFVVFSAIGGGIFLMGISLQAVLTGGFHVSALASYLIQAIASVEASFLLNRWLTWRDRSTPFWSAFLRFNAQKTVTIALNLALYAGLLRLSVNYLLANVVLTILFTIVNYVAGDRLVFVPNGRPRAQPDAPTAVAPTRDRQMPRISVVIPCKDNELTIGPAVQSLIDQDYPGLSEILLIGSVGDHTWDGLITINDPRVTIWEVDTPPGLRDANFKRDAAIRGTSGDLIALVDSDIVLPSDWLSRAVAALEDSGTRCVTGGMKSIHDSFWGRYTDSTWIGAKTPRIGQSYTVTSADFGLHGHKPPITANALFTRELYENCPIDPSWSHGSYEDYEWFWRVTTAGYSIFVCRELFGWHHHRRGLRALAREYRRSSRGCAYFVRAHLDCPFAKRRLRQVIILPLAAVAMALALAVASADGYGKVVATVALGCTAVLAVHQVARSRSLESLAYPVVGLLLGLVFTTGLAINLIHPASAVGISPVRHDVANGSQEGQRQRSPKPSLLSPLLAICAVQIGLSLALVRSNTAYTDEADCLWVGRLEIAHWLHGTSWPSMSAYEHLSGSPLVYPPLGALAASVGGIVGARILSLGFMIAATVLLYAIARQLNGRAAALFASALWAVSEPAMRLAFATYDPLSVLLTAVSAWLIVQVASRRHRGEFVAAAAFTLAVANVTAYPSVVIDPVVISFAFLVWLRDMRWQRSLSFAAWLAMGWVLFFGLLMTFSHSWVGLISSLWGANGVTYQGIASTLNQEWEYSALIAGLAVIGAVLSIRNIGKGYIILLGGFSFVAFVLSQFRAQNPASVDAHLSYGIWFAAILAGYACARFIRWIPGANGAGAKRVPAALCCVVAFVFPAVSGWQSAWQRYHAWPDAAAFVASFKPLAAQSQGFLYLPGRQVNIAEFYTPGVDEWTRWSAALSLDPLGVPHTSWGSYYSAQLHSQNYGVIALFYSTTFSSVKLPGDILLSSSNAGTYQKLLGLVGENSGEPGLPLLTLALERDRQYHLAAVGHYNTSNVSGTHDYGIYAIWKKDQT